MDESKFIEKLQKRAQEQEQVLKTVPFPNLFTFTIKWLSFHPWRLLIPLSFIISLLLWGIFGNRYIDAILTLFRWWS